MTRDRGGKVTLKHIAQRVGVSAMTVSRALSGKEALVDPRTARRIRDVAAEMGYTPNLLARSLRGERLPTIVVFAEQISRHIYLAELMDHVARAIEERDYGMIACQSPQSLRAALTQFNLAGAVVLAPPESLFYDEQGRPFQHLRVEEPLVVIHCAVEQRFFTEVSPDLADAARQAAEHLLQLGHRRIAFLGGPSIEMERTWVRTRQSGIERAFKPFGLDDSALRYQPCDGPEEAAEALKSLLRTDPRVTGVICLNDEIAVAAIHGARELGREVPRDLSVIGSNDTRMAWYFRPALTTIRIDVPALVEKGLSLLFEEIGDSRPDSNGRRRLPHLEKCELIVRASTAPPA